MGGERHGEGLFANYSSNIKIAYNNSKIIDYFINNNYNFVPYKPEKFLLIIFDQQLFSENILSKENKFYEYLILNKKKYEYFIIPNLDVNDRFLINKDDFITKKIENYYDLNNKYKNNNIILVHSKSDLNQIKLNSYFYINNNFEKIDEISFTNIDFDLFFEHLQNISLDNWKKNNLVISSEISNIKCRIKTLNLIELKIIKKIIQSTNIIKNINPDEISYNNSIYSLIYYGNLEILIKSLKKEKLELIIDNNECSIKIL